MQLYDLLAEQEAAITHRWFNLIIDSYPADASGFLKNQKNRFLNPVGNTIAREIVVYHGGRIWVESEPGKGSCFRFTLPLVRQVSPQALEEATSSPTGR